MAKADWTLEDITAKIKELEDKSCEWQTVGNAKFAGLEWDEWLELDGLKRRLEEVQGEY